MILRILIFISVLMGVSALFGTHVPLLIKIPTRGRPEQFFNQLDKYYQKLSGGVKYHFVISCDQDDPSMNNPAVLTRLQAYPHLSVHVGISGSKVAAYNRDLEHYTFDVLMVAADDKEPVLDKYDQLIMRTMRAYFPDTDGVLNFYDGFVAGQCNTMPIMGKKFYDRFGYVYNPAYEALYANQELTLITKIVRKEAVRPELLAKHMHPIWTNTPWDDLYIRNEACKTADQQVFNERQKRFFNLDPVFIAQAHSKDWSILICTLTERQESFKKLYNTLVQQIEQAGLQDRIEILVCKDNRQFSIGYKRNILLAQSEGTYVNFLDDDDTVHDQYITMIYEQLKHKPDCVKLIGTMTTQGAWPQTFIHSQAYSTYEYRNGCYYRPPNHLTTIKRAIAVQIWFQETNFAEDKRWSEELAQTGLIKDEAPLTEPYYFYHYDGKYEAAPSVTNKLDMLVYSYNRALQLDAFLTSCYKHVIGLHTLTVIFRADNQHRESYQTLMRRYPRVRFIAQSTDNPRSDFKEHTLTALNTSSSRYILFAVDDNIITDTIDLLLCTEQLEHTQAYGFFMRMGKHITSCLTQGLTTALPPLRAHAHDVYSWQFGAGTGEWCYPHSLDMSLYRIADITGALTTLTYTSPNTLEGSWAQIADTTKRGLCFGTAKSINIQINRVQDDWPYVVNKELTPEYLLAQFKNNLAIDTHQFYHFTHSDPHVEEVPLRFINAYPY